MFEFLIGLTKH